MLGLLVVSSAACGKRGDPLPPVTVVPARVTDFTARRLADRLELQLTVPAANLDGSTPPAVDYIEVYSQVVAAGAPAPTAAQLTGDARNLRTRIAVRRDEATAAPSGVTDPRPTPGENARFVQRVDSAEAAAGATLYLTLVTGVGQGRGRPGPASEVVAVPLATLPAPAAAVVLSHDEKQLTLAWTPAAAGQSFQVFRGVPGGDLRNAELLTPAPTTATQLTIPVGEFGRQHCFSVRALDTTGHVTIEGTPGPAQCITPVDRYPPPAPSNLQAVQEGTYVTLIWTRVEAADLAGYVVLRGTAAGENMEPLMRAPVAETTFRDTSVQVGSTYSYAVIALDTAPTPNLSQLSNRQTVTVR